MLVGSVALKECDHFTIKVVSTKNRHICIGVVDSALRNKRYVSWDHAHILFYYGLGSVYGDAKSWIKSEGSGYKAGDTVGVKANLQTGEVTWTVNGDKQATHTMAKIKDGNIRWVPYIKMYNNGDAIEWML